MPLLPGGRGDAAAADPQSDGTAIAATTTYIQEERRKREEEEARLQALAEAREERRKKLKERKIEKMEAQRAQEAAWEAARQEELKQGNPLHTEIKIARMEEAEGVEQSKDDDKDDELESHT